MALAICAKPVQAGVLELRRSGSEGTGMALQTFLQKLHEALSAQHACGILEELCAQFWIKSHGLEKHAVAVARQG